MLAQKAGTLEQLRGENALLKRQLSAERRGETSREGSGSDSDNNESARVDTLRGEVVRLVHAP